MSTEAIKESVTSSKNDNSQERSSDHDEDEWIKELKKCPLLMTEVPDEIDPEEHPTLAALQALKYEDEEDSAEVKADNYKVDGNFHFKKKLYHKAITAYSEGIKQNCKDDELNAQLFNNRAACHSYLGNNKSALNDAIEAKKLQPRYVKAFIRGALACIELNRFEEAIEWCGDGLQYIEPDNKKLKELRLKAVKNQKINDRNQRKEAFKVKAEEATFRSLLHAIKERGITLQGMKADCKIADMTLSAMKAILTPQDPLDVSSIVKLDDQVLHWSILFLYPEHNQTDIYKSASEENSFFDLLVVMFDEDNFPSWDKERKYKLRRLELYFEDKDTSRLHRLDMHHTLKETIADNR